jgi:hypothetical protein
MTDANNGSGYEEKWAIFILWVALTIYIMASFWLKNPLYACVLIWASFAIADE